MSIADKLQQLDTIKADIKTAINNKGGNVDNDFTTYATAIENIKSGENFFEITNDTALAFSQFTEIPSYIRLGESTTKAKNLFRQNEKLLKLPDWDFSNINNAFGMCYNCLALKHPVFLDMPNLVDCTNMFNNTPLLTDITLLNTSKCTNFASAFAASSTDTAALMFVGEIDCSSATVDGTSNMFQNQKQLSEMGGLRNLGMGFGKLSKAYSFNLSYSSNIKVLCV